MLNRDPVPDEFASIQEAAEFWDTHDLADYDDQLHEVTAEVDIRRRAFLVALEPDLARQVSAYAEQHGVSTETLINVWLTEKLSATSTAK